ncbi:hypothetical protein [Gordonia sp. CNJ-863]|uniref:hypothetical protein n=1 Tax=Gordonia sp. CNJ-863 TaxID=1904963 RepID=UPI000AF7C1BB|nr:hypothetical protein [Gordonia sp. CNJ-863]
MNVLTVAGIVPGPRYSVEATLATGIGHDGTAGRELPVRVWRYQASSLSITTGSSAG